MEIVWQHIRPPHPRSSKPMFLSTTGHHSIDFSFELHCHGHSRTGLWSVIVPLASCFCRPPCGRCSRELCNQGDLLPAPAPYFMKINVVSLAYSIQSPCGPPPHGCMLAFPSAQLFRGSCVLRMTHPHVTCTGVCERSHPHTHTQAP